MFQGATNNDTDQAAKSHENLPSMQRVKTDTCIFMGVYVLTSLPGGAMGSSVNVTLPAHTHFWFLIPCREAGGGGGVIGMLFVCQSVRIKHFRV